MAEDPVGSFTLDTSQGTHRIDTDRDRFVIERQLQDGDGWFELGPAKLVPRTKGSSSLFSTCDSASTLSIPCANARTA